jgi:hypothetical protein
MSDAIRGAYYGRLNLLRALQAGDSYRIARALGIHLTFVSGNYRPGMRAIRRLGPKAQALARDTEHPHAVALVELGIGVASCLNGSWSGAVESCGRAEGILLARCPGAFWEVSTVRRFSIIGLFYSGRIREMALRQRRYHEDAEARGDVYSLTLFRLGTPNAAWLVDDDTTGARQQLEAALENITTRGFHLQHFMATLAFTHLALYQGQPERAFDRMEAIWPRLRKSLLMRTQMVRGVALWARAASTLALGRSLGDRSLMGRAEEQTRLLAREDAPWLRALARGLDAAVAANSGRDDVPERLRRAAAAYEAEEMPLYATAVRWQLGNLDSSGAGAELAHACEQRFVDEGIRRPLQWANMLLPGFAR